VKEPAALTRLLQREHAHNYISMDCVLIRSNESKTALSYVARLAFRDNALPRSKPQTQQHNLSCHHFEREK
jgi:hypothetical protein